VLETARRVGLSVFGFQQPALWGWGNPAIWAAIAVGVILLVVFFAVEARTESPLINVRIFRNRTFLVENIVPGIAMTAFIPVFFVAAIYGRIALAQQATTASLLTLYFFLGFVVCAQTGGRMLDRIGAKRPVVLGCVLAAVGFGLWAGKATDLQVGAQVIYGGQDRPAAGRQRQPDRHPGVHPGRLRRRNPGRALRHVRDHGRRGTRGPTRPQARRPRRYRSSRNRRRAGSFRRRV
jgi:hypothetical protein